MKTRIFIITGHSLFRGLRVKVKINPRWSIIKLQDAIIAQASRFFRGHGLTVLEAMSYRMDVIVNASVLQIINGKPDTEFKVQVL